MASTYPAQTTGTGAPWRPSGVRLRRRVAARPALLALLIIATALVIVVPGALFRARAISGPSMDYVGRINSLRASRGLSALVVDGNLTSLAEQHSARMASTRQLVHTGSLSAGVALPWAKLGENVGQGSTPDMVWQAFLSSPAHYANITSPAYTHIGVGVVVDGSGVLWTTQRFLAAAGAPAVAAAPAPRATRPPPPAPAPAAPAPRPAPAVVAPPVTAPPVTVAPPPPIEPPPADPVRVAGVLDALRVPPTATQPPGQPETRAASVLSALRSR